MKKKFRLGLLSTLLIASLAIAGCSKKVEEPSADEVRTPPKNLPIATIEVEGFGTIEAELYPHIAPNTVNNFISLANSGFYNNLTFHRIIEGFMIQGGDPEGTGMGGPGYSIKGEFGSNGFYNDLVHSAGVLSMARSQNKDSAGSQFFIMAEDSPHLDGEYAAFGKVISGMDVVKSIEKTETGSNDAPVEKVVIKSITVDTKGENYPDPEKM